jgi:hypothetical protein
VLFGLGDVDRVDVVEVRWPSGHVDRVPDVPVDRYVTLTEGEGLTPSGEEPEPGED